MRTAAEMEKYAKDNKFIYYGSSALKHFKLIETTLLPDEDVILPLAPGIGPMEVEALVFTNKNIIVAHKSLLDTYTVSVGLDKVRNISTATPGFFDGEILIETLDKKIHIRFSKKIVKILHPQIVAIIEDYRKKQASNQKKASHASLADELKKYAELLKEGVITNQEFESIKTRLMK